ncbi:MAG TPA: hypothetical protein DDX19_22425 [Rhodopirellula baltica]|nr:hypothetical protein [Rhodopirellula baltica]
MGCFPFHVADGGPPSANESQRRQSRWLTRCHVLAEGPSLAAMVVDTPTEGLSRLRGAGNERPRKGGQGHEVPAGCRHWRQPMKTSVAVVPPRLQSRSDGIRPALGFNPRTISA